MLKIFITYIIIINHRYIPIYYSKPWVLHVKNTKKIRLKKIEFLTASVSYRTHARLLREPSVSYKTHSRSYIVSWCFL
ncbi:unnamed protein product [Diabrotica balteata]|uniref:Uncharacterized protein n=1 Tax=Diabrotica balteata TaxID=107213 RepID=A0A9N9SY45_DIABA|nr:unnamed protein product [Diabrotica balteata]